VLCAENQGGAENQHFLLLHKKLRIEFLIFKSNEGELNRWAITHLLTTNLYPQVHNYIWCLLEFKAQLCTFGVQSGSFGFLKSSIQRFCLRNSFLDISFCAQKL
jgi:hypothetical protein